jgi:dTDP-4-amino-4,6-dideoxygalactose transaminase
MKTKIWLSPPHLTGEEQKYINKAFKSNWIAPLGPNVDAFEASICQFTKNPYCTVLSSGTAAIHLALIILGVKKEDEVICPTFTFSATINPVIYVNAKPIFIDSEKDTLNMSPILLEKCIKDRIKLNKKPKAIILVHIYGMPAKIDEILKIAKTYEIPIIEDAANTLGSKFQNKHLGTFGDIGIYSFNGNKIITTSGGGALVSKNPDYCKQATFLATQARDNAPYYQHSQIGYNYRMSNVLAGIGCGQMEVLNDRIDKRRANFDFYKSKLKDINSLRFVEETDDYFSNRWLTIVLTDSFETREKIRLTLEKEAIESRPLWKPMHQQPIFKMFKTYTDGTAEELFQKGLCLPSGSNLTQEEKNRIISAIKSCF